MKVYGLIGFPLSHSFSEDYFRNKFSKENITESVYKLFSIEDISMLPELIKSEPELVGLNVTMPFKEQILKYIDTLDETAKNIGAVNTVKIKKVQSLNSELRTPNYELFGYNTDIYGFEKSIEPLLKQYHKKGLILGTGGASKAIAYALKQLNISYTFVSRNKIQNSSSNNEQCSTINYVDIDKNILDSHLIIINTTSLGMYPDINTKPDIPYEFITEHHLTIDLIYNPTETLFLKKCKSKHAIIQNGLLVLHLQAEKSWKIWNTI